MLGEDGDGVEPRRVDDEIRIRRPRQLQGIARGWSRTSRRERDGAAGRHIGAGLVPALSGIVLGSMQSGLGGRRPVVREDDDLHRLVVRPVHPIHRIEDEGVAGLVGIGREDATPLPRVGLVVVVGAAAFAAGG